MNIAATEAEFLASHNPRPELNKQGYRWILREIEKLDPYEDYELIWTLSTSYNYGDFILNVLYTLGMPNFTMPPETSAMLTENTGKVIKMQQKRMIDTNQTFWQWFEYGPSHPNVRRSLTTVNQIHMALNKKYPGHYPARDFIYTCVWIGVALHRLKLALGLPAWTETQQIACHLYWKNLCGQFHSQEGQIEDFPNSFDEMLSHAEEYEARPWGQSESGKQLAEAITQQFANCWFPWGTRWAGRQFVLTMQAPKTREVMQMSDPNWLMSKLIPKGVWLVFWLKDRVLPDAKLTTPARMRAKSKLPITHIEPKMAKISECPFHPKTSGESVHESK